MASKLQRYGFWIVPLNTNGTERHRHWTADEDRAHRYAQLDSEEYGAAYILYPHERPTGPYFRILAIYKHGARYRVEPGQLWLKLPAVQMREVAA